MHLLPLFPLLVALLALPAAAITITTDARDVFADGLTSLGTTTSTMTESLQVIHPGGPSFTQGVDALGTYAWQTSTTFGTGISGNGRSNGPTPVDIAHGTARSTLSIVFEVTTASEYALFGSVSAVALPGPFGPNSSGSATASVILSDAGGSLFTFSATTTGVDDTLAFDESLLLDPGTYTLFAESSTSANGYGLGSSWAATLVVPEPSTALLLGLGLALMRPMRSRRFVAAPATRGARRRSPRSSG